MKSWIVGTVIGIVFLFGIGTFTYGAVVLSRGSADEIVGDLDFAWSPDGIRIAFTSDRNGNEEVLVVEVSTGEETNLTNSEAPDRQPTWSPDGSKIAFLSSPFGGTDIYVMNADGTGRTNLTNRVASYGRPGWSPDGSRIAFTSNRELQPIEQRTGPDSSLLVERLEPEIYVMSADGSAQTRLTFNRSFDGNISWSPDSSKLTFTSDRDGNREIYVMNADGGGLTRLTDNDRSDILPAWSPDGLRIAFSSDRPITAFGESFPSLAHDIYIMNSDGSDQTNLTQNPQVSFCRATEVVAGRPAPRVRRPVLRAGGNGGAWRGRQRGLHQPVRWCRCRCVADHGERDQRPQSPHGPCLVPGRRRHRIRLSPDGYLPHSGRVTVRGGPPT